MATQFLNRHDPISRRFLVIQINSPGFHLTAVCSGFSLIIEILFSPPGDTPHYLFFSATNFPSMEILGRISGLLGQSVPVLFSTFITLHVGTKDACFCARITMISNSRSKLESANILPAWFAWKKCIASQCYYINWLHSDCGSIQTLYQHTVKGQTLPHRA